MIRFIKIIIFVAIFVFVIHLLLKVRINHIDIVGNEHVSDAEIVTEFFEKDIDRTSLFFFIKSKFGKEKNIPLVNSYTIEWITPFSVVIHVEENKAIGFLKRDLKNVYFDKDGTIIDVTEDRKPNVVEVIGISFRNFEKGEKIDFQNEKILKAILNITSFLSEHELRSELIEIKQNSNILIYIDRIVVDMGNIDNMEIKLLRLNDIYPKISDLSGTLDLSNARENMLDEQYIFKKAS